MICHLFWQGSITRLDLHPTHRMRSRDITDNIAKVGISLQWRHNAHDSVSNHQPHHCLLKRLYGRRSKKTSKLCVTGLCVGTSPGTGEFPAQMASNAENVPIWWRHHVTNSVSIPYESRDCMIMMLKQLSLFRILTFYRFHFCSMMKSCYQMALEAFMPFPSEN